MLIHKSRFQYVALQLEALKSAESPAEVEHALKNLPADLDETYQRALLSIPISKKAKAIRALHWLSFSIRPLTVGELAEAVLIDVARPVQQCFNPEDRYFNISDVETLLPGLLTITDETHWSVSHGNDREIRFSHFSIKEYLISERICEGKASAFAVLEVNAHILIAKACLNYHLYISEVESSPRPQEIYSLWDTYAGDFGPQHLEVVAREQWTPELIESLRRFYAPESDSLRLLLEYFSPDYDGTQGRYFTWIFVGMDPVFPSPLYYASSLGYRQQVEWILGEKLADVNQIAGQCGTAINAAARHGHDAIVALLLKNGANPYLGIEKNDGYRLAMQAAIHHNHERCVEALLESPDPIQQCQKVGYWPLVAASDGSLSDGSNVRILSLLLQRGADIEAHDPEGMTALQSAVAQGNDDARDFLLENGADVNKDGPHGPAVLLAGVRGDLDALKVLLLHGAVIIPRGEDWEDLVRRARPGNRWWADEEKQLEGFQRIFGEPSRRPGGIQKEEIDAYLREYNLKLPWPKAAWLENEGGAG